FTGATNSNAPGNTCGSDQYGLWGRMGEVNRVAASFLKSIDEGLVLGSTNRENRDKAFAELLNGLSLGYMALFYDSAAVITPKMDAVEAGDLPPAKVVMDSALAALQRAIDYANAPGTGDNGWPLPGTWIASPTSYTAPEFIKFV